MQKFETQKITKRKVQARKFSKANEGKVRVETPTGKYWLEDNDWLIPIGGDKYVVIPGTAMEFLQSTDKETV